MDPKTITALKRLVSILEKERKGEPITNEDRKYFRDALAGAISHSLKEGRTVSTDVAILFGDSEILVLPIENHETDPDEGPSIAHQVVRKSSSYDEWFNDTGRMLSDYQVIFSGMNNGFRIRFNPIVD